MKGNKEYAVWGSPTEEEIAIVGEKLFRQARNKIRKSKSLYKAYNALLSHPPTRMQGSQGSSLGTSFELGYLGKRNRGLLDSIPGAAWCAGKDYRRAEEQLWPE